MAEWLRNGLQNRVPRFNSGRGLQPSPLGGFGSAGHPRTKGARRSFSEGGRVLDCTDALQPREAFVIGRLLSKSAVFPGSSAVEQPAVNRLVAGSNPARGAKLFQLLRPNPSTRTKLAFRSGAARRRPSPVGPRGSFVSKLFDGIKQRVRFARAACHEWRRVGWWLAAFAALFALPYLWASGPDRVQWQGMFFQWAGILVVAWGLADTRRNVFGKPPLHTSLWDRLSRVRYIIKPPGPIVATMSAIEADDDFMTAYVQIRNPVVGDLEARIEALAKNQRLVDQEVSTQRQVIDRLETEVTERIGTEMRERSDADKRIRVLLEGAIIGGIHLEFAGVGFLLIGIAFTSIPNWIASLLKFVSL